MLAETSRLRHGSDHKLGPLGRVHGLEQAPFGSIVVRYEFDRLQIADSANRGRAAQPSAC